METGGIVNEVVTDDKWLTLREASKITGKSINALRLLISRHKLTRVKKAHDNNGSYWMIHKDEVDRACQDMNPHSQPCQSAGSQDMEGAMIPLLYHDSKQREWTEERDQLQAGLLMYRYKFEELDRQIRLLPAPVEAVSTLLQDRETKLSELAEKEQELRDSRQAVKALEEALQAERQRSWWDRLWKR